MVRAQLEKLWICRSVEITHKNKNIVFFFNCGVISPSATIRWIRVMYEQRVKGFFLLFLQTPGSICPRTESRRLTICLRFMISGRAVGCALWCCGKEKLWQFGSMVFGESSCVGEFLWWWEHKYSLVSSLQLMRSVLFLIIKSQKIHLWKSTVALIWNWNSLQQLRILPMVLSLFGLMKKNKLPTRWPKISLMFRKLTISEFMIQSTVVNQNNFYINIFEQFQSNDILTIYFSVSKHALITRTMLCKCLVLQLCNS